jgi:hypothetical protein
MAIPELSSAAMYSHDMKRVQSETITNFGSTTVRFIASISVCSLLIRCHGAGASGLRLAYLSTPNPILRTRSERT